MLMRKAAFSTLRTLGVLSRVSPLKSWLLLRLPACDKASQPARRGVPILRGPAVSAVP